MNKLEALVALNMVAEIGSIRLKKLLDYFDKPENILKAAADKLAAVSGIGEKIAARIVALKKEDLDQEFSLANKLGLDILIPEDAGYPENLKNIPDPPIVLYVKGCLKKEDRLSIAIVGSRRASFYGISSAGKFAADLAGQGFSVVSGMARGIDTSAHKGALKAGGRTLAVIGSGFNRIYPPENQDLADEIAANGAVISEFPVDTAPLKQNFPRRNRVISGLSLGVLVAEAARNSGALITADFALEQGREVFALPGKVDAPNSFGTNGLIRQGARLVSCAEDILEELNIPVAIARREDVTPVPLSTEETLLYNILSQQPLPLDEIVEQTGCGIPRISQALFTLQIKRMVKQLPGKQFIRIEH